MGGPAAFDRILGDRTWPELAPVRFGIGWWLVVLFGLPVIALLLDLIFGGSLHTADLGPVVIKQLGSIVLAVVVMNLWEETVWAGFFQTRLEARFNFRWRGIALVAAGGSMVVTTPLHPSRETARTIVSSEPRLVAAHVVYTLTWLLVMLGLPGLYAAQPGAMGRLGLASFLTAFTGTYLIAMTGNFGFLAPGLAKQSPAVFDSISQYPPVVIINGLAAICS